jgi:hypothetical protein
MRFEISPPTLTLNSWKKLCIGPFKEMAFKPIGKSRSTFTQVIKVDNPKKTEIDFTSHYTDDGEHNIHYLISLDKSCFDDKKTGENKALEALHTAWKTKNKVHNGNIRLDGATGVIGSIALKMSKLFDPMIDYTLIDTLTSMRKHYTAGVYGESIIIGYSEANIEFILEQNMINLFS